MPSAKPQIVEALLHAAIVTLVASRALLEAVRRCLGELAERTPTQRWAALLEAVASELLAIVTAPLRHAHQLGERLAKLLIHDAVDPNAGRLSLLPAVESGVHAYRPRLRTPHHA